MEEEELALIEKKTPENVSSMTQIVFISISLRFLKNIGNVCHAFLCL